MFKNAVFPKDISVTNISLGMESFVREKRVSLFCQQKAPCHPELTSLFQYLDY